MIRWLLDSIIMIMAGTLAIVLLVVLYQGPKSCEEMLGDTVMAIGDHFRVVYECDPLAVNSSIFKGANISDELIF
jgi:hypothetical protein